MDDVLTSGRAKMRMEVWNELDRIIEPYGIGLEIREVAIQDVRPPTQVRSAFDDAVAAREDEERLIKEAEAYAAEREPRARGEAKRILEDAEAYRQQVTLEATGEVARFDKLLPEYLAAPQITRDRLYLEAMEQVVTGSRSVVVDQSGGNQGLFVLPLDKLAGDQRLVTPPRDLNSSTAVEPRSSGVEPAANWSRDGSRSDGRSSTRQGRGE